MAAGVDALGSRTQDNVNLRLIPRPASLPDTVSVVPDFVTVNALLMK
jgi:hypothetical protein